jgi:hypothetical protein
LEKAREAPWMAALWDVDGPGRESGDLLGPVDIRPRRDRAARCEARPAREQLHGWFNAYELWIV